MTDTSPLINPLLYGSTVEGLRAAIDGDFKREAHELLDSLVEHLEATQRKTEKYREWVERIWVGAEQEMWDERHGPDSWQLELKRAYRERAVEAETETERLRQFIADFVGSARSEHHIS